MEFLSFLSTIFENASENQTHVHSFDHTIQRFPEIKFHQRQ